MARATFPHQKGRAVPVQPIFKIKCSTCPNFQRFERARNAVEAMRWIRDMHGWMWVSFGLVYCPACRPTERTFPDWEDHKAPENLIPEPVPDEIAEIDEEGVTWL